MVECKRKLQRGSHSTQKATTWDTPTTVGSLNEGRGESTIGSQIYDKRKVNITNAQRQNNKKYYNIGLKI